jgi:hypothetical protein
MSLVSDLPLGRATSRAYRQSIHRRGDVSTGQKFRGLQEQRLRIKGLRRRQVRGTIHRRTLMGG